MAFQTIKCFFYKEKKSSLTNLAYSETIPATLSETVDFVTIVQHLHTNAQSHTQAGEFHLAEPTQCVVNSVLYIVNGRSVQVDCGFNSAT